MYSFPGMFYFSIIFSLSKTSNKLCGHFDTQTVLGQANVHKLNILNCWQQEKDVSKGAWLAQNTLRLVNCI